MERSMKKMKVILKDWMLKTTQARGREDNQMKHVLDNLEDKKWKPMCLDSSTISRSKKKEGMDELWKNYTWHLFTRFSSWYLPKVPKEVVFTIGKIYLSLLLLPRCLFPGFHQSTFFLFFFLFLEFLERIQAFFNLNSTPIYDKPRP